MKTVIKNIRQLFANLLCLHSIVLGAVAVGVVLGAVIVIVIFSKVSMSGSIYSRHMASSSSLSTLEKSVGMNRSSSVGGQLASSSLSR